MNTPTRRPETTNAWRELEANGSSQDGSGIADPAGASPAKTFTSATTANTASASICTTIIASWKRAVSAVPATVSAVRATIATAASAITAHFDSAAALQPTSSNRY